MVKGHLGFVPFDVEWLLLRIQPVVVPNFEPAALKRTNKLDVGLSWLKGNAV